MSLHGDTGDVAKYNWKTRRRFPSPTFRI